MEKAAAAFKPNRIGVQEVMNQRDALKKLHIEWLDRNKPDLPEVVYHYTNAAAFHDVIANGTIQATHISFLNDYTEYLHAIVLLREVVTYLQGTPLAGIIHNPLATIKETLDSFRLEDIPPICVACFADARDDLAQWRAYAPGENGIAIGMNLKQLYHAALTKEIELHPVVYDQKKQFDLAWTLIKWGCNRLAELAATVEEYQRPEWAHEWITQFTYTAAYFAPLFKAEGWRSEKEWRVIKWCVNPADTQTLKSSKGGLSIRALFDLRCEVENQHGKQFRLPVQEILMAPQQPQQVYLTRMAVTKHLEAHSYFGVTVTSSGLPLR